MLTLQCAMLHVAGFVGGPIMATAFLARMLLRPALLAGGVHFGMRWFRRHRTGVAALLRALASGRCWAKAWLEDLGERGTGTPDMLAAGNSSIHSFAGQEGRMGPRQ